MYALTYLETKNYQNKYSFIKFFEQCILNIKEIEDIN